VGHLKKNVLIGLSHENEKGSRRYEFTEYNLEKNF
jgi:hypothetical protein